jgi:type I thyroxine 5'-deiodinase
VLNKLYEQYKDRVAFYVVYIQEAHSSDVWQMASNIRDKVIFRLPQSFDERTEVASSCVLKLGIKIPAVVDDMNNSAERAYTGWPDRIYLIDRDGRVVLKTKPGPFGFKPSLLDKHLERLVPAWQVMNCDTPQRWISTPSVLQRSPRESFRSALPRAGPRKSERRPDRSLLPAAPESLVNLDQSQ